MTAATPAGKPPPGPPVPPRPPVSKKKSIKRRMKRLNKGKQKENGATTLFYYTVSRPPFIVVEN